MIRNAKIVHLDTGQTTVTAICLGSGKEYSVTVPTSGYKAWLGGALIQNAMPNVSLDDREFLISGYSPEGWNSLFGTGEEQEED